MKYRFLYIFFLSLIATCILNAEMPPFPSAANLPPELQMSEQDLTEMVNFLDGLSDQDLKELEDLGKQVLTDMGYDAETLEPINPNTPSIKDLYAQQQKQPTETLQEPAVPILVEAPTVNTEELAEYLKKLLKHLHNLQHKALSPLLEERRLSRWAPELRDLNFYVTTIAHSEHLSRLQSKEYELLLKNLKELGTVLIHHEPLFIIAEPVYDVTDDSYEILGISSHATHEEIEDAYKKIKAKKSPEAIKSALTESGASDKDIQRAIRETRLTMSHITDAYEKLQDPKTREQIDRERHAHIASSDTMTKGSQKSLDALLNAISNAIYTQQILNEFEQFFKKYEPTKLEQKKALDKAEADRKKEQLESEKLVPKKTIGTFEPGARKSNDTEASHDKFDNFGFDYPYYGDSGYGSEPTMPKNSAAGSSGTGNTETGGAKGSKAGKAGKDNKTGKDDKDGKTNSKGSDKKEDKKKEEPSKLEKLFTKIENSLAHLKAAHLAGRKDTIEEAWNKIDKDSPTLVQDLEDFAHKVSRADKKTKEAIKKKWADLLSKHELHFSDYLERAAQVNNKHTKEKELIETQYKKAIVDENTEVARKAEQDLKPLNEKKTFHHVMEQLKTVTKKIIPDSKSKLVAEEPKPAAK